MSLVQHIPDAFALRPPEQAEDVVPDGRNRLDDLGDHDPFAAVEHAIDQPDVRPADFDVIELVGIDVRHSSPFHRHRTLPCLPGEVAAELADMPTFVDAGSFSVANSGDISMPQPSGACAFHFPHPERRVMTWQPINTAPMDDDARCFTLSSPASPGATSAPGAAADLTRGPIFLASAA